MRSLIRHITHIRTYIYSYIRPRSTQFMRHERVRVFVCSPETHTHTRSLTVHTRGDLSELCSKSNLHVFMTAKSQHEGTGAGARARVPACWQRSSGARASPINRVPHLRGAITHRHLCAVKEAKIVHVRQTTYDRASNRQETTEKNKLNTVHRQHRETR